MNTLQAIRKINPNAKALITRKSGELKDSIEWLDGTAEISEADINAKKAEFAYIEARDWLIIDNKRLGYNVKNYDLHPNLTAVEDTRERLDIVSNGFKMRDASNANNKSGGSYIYMAFGQSIVGTNNIPATAR